MLFKINNIEYYKEEFPDGYCYYLKKDNNSFGLTSIGIGDVYSYISKEEYDKALKTLIIS